MSIYAALRQFAQLYAPLRHFTLLYASLRHFTLLYCIYFVVRGCEKHNFRVWSDT